ncbi:hypothetical protein BTO17_06965 [Polaribacter reichenbachii]|nr:hypothetical protein BTO17_06965 [Polaribacter reichenbachii]
MGSFFFFFKLILSNNLKTKIAMRKILFILLLMSLSFCLNAQDLLSGGSNSWIFHTPDDGRTTLHLTSMLNGSWQWGKETVFYNNGNVKFNGELGIGTSVPMGKLDILLGGWSNIPRVLFKQTSDNPSMRLYRPSGSGSSIYSWWIENTGNGGLNFKYGYGSSTGSESPVSKFTFTNNGDFGIGTTTPDSKLSVNGTIHAKEVKIDLIGWPDYVFRKEYQLLTLEEVESYVKKNGHLPRISSADEVEKNGVLLGEISKKLLEKIEELTLYAIYQEKIIKEQNQKNKDLEKRLSKIESLIINK